jgi:uncharacterized protein YbjT (DUF2867 family)
MVTILGAGGAIGSELVKQFTAHNEPIRLVSRNPKLVPGAAEAVSADLSNLSDTVKAVSGSRIAFLLVGLKYDIRVWRTLWPTIMRNAIEAAKRANARNIRESTSLWDLGRRLRTEDARLGLAVTIGLLEALGRAVRQKH